MPTEDQYDQDVMIASLQDVPDAATLASAIANALAAKVNMSFASTSARAATLTSPVEGMEVWLRDVNQKWIYDGTAWRQMTIGVTDTVSDQQSSSYDVLSTSYTTTASSGTYAHCQVVFTAPVTGKVEIKTSARMINETSTSGCLVAPQTRSGGTPGSGSIIEDASDGLGPSNYGNTFSRHGVSHLLTGLTPGSVYNTRLLHRTSVTAATATFALRELIVSPAS
ncbi:hypothetical protein OG875_04675 [Streptomyces sp. NBC_01498]|uniref:hypothetical protein n=1 Tax=Streptomyces sp. NBC_01498 TaxID=2975870 RepID=UPI002E7C1700|nr:hypothetical protein [Streptomyces sp. NBC_01498]WTL23950.1 hypothetical protein OG875_04675 [Streptomyces sp. NBC_01498]